MQKITKSLLFSELKFQDEERVVEGYASTFGNTDGVGDVIVMGAFSKSLGSKRQVKLFYQHDWKNVIGKIVEIYEDVKGLYIKCQLAKTVMGEEVYELLKMGALDSFSIGFSIPKGGFEYDSKKNLRYIKEADLFEVSVVSIPANERAMVTAVKSLSGIREFEHLLKERGFSNSESEIIASKSWQALQSLREVSVEQSAQGEPVDKEEKELNALNQLLTKLKGNNND